MNDQQKRKLLFEYASLFNQRERLDKLLMELETKIFSNGNEESPFQGKAHSAKSDQLLRILSQADGPVSAEHIVKHGVSRASIYKRMPELIKAKLARRAGYGKYEAVK